MSTVSWHSSVRQTAVESHHVKQEQYTECARNSIFSMFDSLGVTPNQARCLPVFSFYSKISSTSHSNWWMVKEPVELGIYIELHSQMLPKPGSMVALDSTRLWPWVRWANVQVFDHGQQPGVNFHSRQDTGNDGTSLGFQLEDLERVLSTSGCR